MSINLWGLVVASGRGTRLGGNKPKQYLPLHNRSILHTSIDAVFSTINQSLILVLAENDTWWAKEPAELHEKVTVTTGGKERQDSVLCGLEKILSEGAAESDWVLVHDAVRPFVSPKDIENLVQTVLNNKSAGGLLGQPCNDTLKVVDGQRVERTQARDKLWQAQTPQLFRLGALRHALNHARQASLAVTDEASAIELMGETVTIVPSTTPNLKITYQTDYQLALCIAQHIDEFLSNSSEGA